MVMGFDEEIRGIFVRRHGHDRDGYADPQQVRGEEAQEQQQTLQVPDAQNFAT